VSQPKSQLDLDLLSINTIEPWRLTRSNRQIQVIPAPRWSCASCLLSVAALSSLRPYGSHVAKS